MFYLVSYYVLVTQKAPIFLPRLQSVIVSNQINYDVSVTGSIITELFQWACWNKKNLLSSSLYYFCFWGLPLSGVMSYFCEEKKLVVSRVDRRRNARFRSIHGYDAVIAVDERFLFLSGFMLFKWDSYLFSSNWRWTDYS